MGTGGDRTGRSTLPTTQLLLATHHARYALLLRAFSAWKRRAQAQCTRRHRIAAACRVGAVFCQRGFWRRWQTFITERRQQRQQEETENQMQDAVADDIERKVEVVDDDCLADVSGSDAEDGNKKDVVVLLRKRHYFKKWSLAIERRLRQVWGAWSTWTREKALREQRRRHAVRFYYLSLLGKGLKGFHAHHTQQLAALSRIETMLDAADARIIASTFSRWDRFTSQNKLRSLKCERALIHSEAQLVRRVWTKGLQHFFDRATAKKRKWLAARELHYSRTTRRSFLAWKGAWQKQRIRNQALASMLNDYKRGKERDIRVAVFGIWSEFTSARAAKRIVNAQVRGQAQHRLIRTYLSQWVTYISFLRWQQITRERAEQHYKNVVTRKCLERWRHNVALRRGYRKQTRTALVHWKLTLQRKAFNGWKQYLQMKRAKQQRIHEALEFRHDQFVRDGLRHWMTAALHLQEQREQQVTRKQATNTEHIWRRVAMIARHWRYLSIRRRTTRDNSMDLERPRDVLRRVPDDPDWLSHHPQRHNTQRRNPVLYLSEAGGSSLQRQGTKPSDAAIEGSNWTGERSPLSEFIMLPRNRPQPRRPVDVLHFGLSEAENLSQSNANTSAREALKCGFQFPTGPFTPLVAPQSGEIELPHYPRQVPSAIRTTTERKIRAEANSSTRNPAGQLMPTSTATQLDGLEQQLLALCQRKREWKTFQVQLEILREEVDANPQILSKLQAMEEQHRVRSKQWSQTKEHIRSLAMEIQLLRNVL